MEMEMEMVNFSIPDSELEENSVQSGPRLTFTVLVLMFCVLGIIASFVFIILLLKLKQKHALSVVFISWAFANILLLSTLMPSFINVQGTWSFGEFWCHAGQYLTKSLKCTMPYLLVIAALLLLFGSRSLWNLSRSNHFHFYLIPVFLSTEVWVFSFALCTLYWSVISYEKVVGWKGTLEVCYYDPESVQAISIVEMVLLYAFPSVLLYALLVTWACLQKGKPLPGSIDRVWVCTLIVFMILYVLTQLDYTVIVPVIYMDESLSSDVLVFHFQVAVLLDLCYHALAPLGALIIMGICRRTLFSDPPQAPTPL